MTGCGRRSLAPGGLDPLGERKSSPHTCYGRRRSVLESLMVEYLETIEQLQQPGYSPDERHQLASQRVVLHEQMLEMLGRERKDIPDMIGFCKEHLRKKGIRR